MSAPCCPEPAWLELGVAGAALEQGISGDHFLVQPGTPRTRLSMMDGLGHGPEAQRASLDCASILAQHPDASLLDLVGYCHAGLRDTRGVALTLAQLDCDQSLLEWVAVGNVEGLVLREGLARGLTFAAVVQRGGVVGYRLPPLKLSHVQLRAGDLIVLATDGIKASFVDVVEPLLDAQQLADRILERCARDSDDRLVLVARYRGGSPS